MRGLILSTLEAEFVAAILEIPRKQIPLGFHLNDELLDVVQLFLGAVDFFNRHSVLPLHHLQFQALSCAC